MNPYDKNDVELEEIKIKDSSSTHKSQKSSIRNVNDSLSYTSGSLLDKPHSKYTPTITSVVSRKKKKERKDLVILMIMILIQTKKMIKEKDLNVI